MSIRGKLIVAVAANRVVLRSLERVRRELDVVAGRLSVGDLDVRPPRAAGGDELGRFEDALGAFVDRVVALLKEGRRRSG